MKIKALILFIVASLSGVLAYAQGGRMDVRGTVTDESGHPVVGAAVVVSPGGSYSVTDAQGSYWLPGVPEGSEITVSCLGYEEQKAKANRGVIDFVLRESMSLLEETVVIGYGTMKKSDLTGSVASVNPEKLIATPSNNIEGILQGRIAGVQVINSSQDPGSSSTVRIRGNSSINGSNTPLVVIDGFPYGDAGNIQINPQDVTSIEVLKDASASAIYGSRGANGVIIITTNKAGQNRTQVSIRQQVTISQFTSELNLWRDTVLMAILANEAQTNAGLTPSYTGTTNSNGVYYPSIYELMTTWTTYTKWDDICFNDAPASNNTTVQVKSSNDRTSFTASLNYFYENGMYVEDTYKKFGGNFSIDHKVFDNFLLKASANVYKGWRNYNNSLSYTRNPIFPVYNDDGTYFQYSATDYYNPVAITELQTYKKSGTNLASYLGLEWQIIPDLTINAQLNYKHGETITDIYYPDKYTETGTNNGGYGAISNWEDDNIVVEAYATYDRIFKKKHHFTGMVGYSYEDYTERSSSLAAVGFVNESLGNENLEAGDSESYRIDNDKVHTELVSGLARLNYVYDNRFLFTFTARADGSSKFGSGNKWAFFPSGAVSWNMHNEQFMKQFDKVNQLKLRLSYGVSGNQGIEAYQTLSQYGQHKYYYNGSWETVIGPGYQSGTTGQDGIYAVWSGIASTDLKWESTEMWDIGVDLSFFDNRLNVTFDWYNKMTFDLLRERNIAPSSGYDKMWVNDGTIRNRGIELTIDGVIYADRDWRVGGTIVFYRNRNKVMSLGDSIEAGLNTDERTGMQYEWYGNLSEQFRAYTNILAVGQPMFVFYGYKVDGIIQTLEEGLSAGLTGDDAYPGEFKYVDIYNEDGLNTIDENDRCIIGDPNPSWTGSLSIDVAWKNLDFNVFFNGVFGNDVVNTKRFDQPSNMPLRWTEDNPTNDYPSLNNSRQTKFSDWWIEDGSFVRIQSVSLGYTKYFKNIKWMDNIRFSVNINNLYTFTNFTGYDPEVSMTGIYSGGYPRLRKYTFGVDINF